MGDHEGWAQPSDLMPNGLLPNEEAYVTRILDQEKWSKAEERTAELIARIQPNKPSEELRNAVADYMQRLITKCFSCQVFTFGSVPLKTYLPDGDIDLSAFSKNQNVKDTWANEVRIMLENEEKSENPEFHVKEVQYIQAEVDHLINQNHLFKRSIILIKAWCYYESRILGAHHGLISTYALETLVLYIFHVFNNSFAGPLEVLYRFLEFFSNFDWENFCVSLWGPVPIRSLPDMTAESPRKDSGELLLSKLFLDACSSVYAVFPAGQENQGQPFVSKHFNVIDPLRTTNNLGRSVSKGNFFRIRSAFAYGAKRLARLLDCPKEDIVTEVNQFFMNTWERHGTGQRPDAPSTGLLRLLRLNLDLFDRTESFNNLDREKNENLTRHESEAEENRAFNGVSNQHDNCTPEVMSRTSHIPTVSRTQRISSRASDQVAWNVRSSKCMDNEKGQRRFKPDYLINDGQDRCPFVRTHSSPELLDTSVEISSRGRRNGAPVIGKNHFDTVRPDYSSRRNNLGSEVSGSHTARSSTNEPPTLRYSPSHQSLDASADSNSASNNYHDEAGLNTLGEELSSLSETMDMHQEEQDLVNRMASSGFHGFGGQVQIPMNIGAPRLPFPISPSVLASMGYSTGNMPGMIPGSIPFVDPHWGTNIQFPHGLVPSSLSHYIPSMELASSPEEMADSDNANPRLEEVNQEHRDQDFWNEHETGSARDFSEVNGTMHTMQFDDKQHPSAVGYNFVSSSRKSSGSSLTRNQRKSSKEENRGLVREDQDDTHHYQNNRGNEGCSSERSANLRSLATSHTSSSRSKASSESSWDGSSVKVSKSTRDKRGRKTAPSPVPSTVAGKGKSGWHHEGVSVDHGSSRADDDIGDWIPLSTMGTEMAERSAGHRSVASSHIQSLQVPSYDSVKMSGSESLLPIAPMVLDSGSRQRVMDNSGVMPFAFYPTGPPVPFLTMLPVYNFPPKRGHSEGSSSHFDKDEEMESSRLYESDQNIDPAEGLDQSEIFSNTMHNRVPLEHLEEQKSDILNSNFNIHWQNLQYARFCQHSRPMLYHPPAMGPAMYLQGHFPWDGPGRPVSSNVNAFGQVMGYGPRLIPVTPLLPGSSRPAGVYQRHGDEIPRYRGGTGTYLPNTKASLRDRQSSGNKNHRGNYSYDHNDHLGDREGNWNVNSRPRYSGRHYARSQSEKGSSRSDRLTTNDTRSNRPWDSYQHEPAPAYHVQNVPYGSSNSAHRGSTDGVHGVYSLQAVNSNGVTPTGPGVPRVVMLYSYDHNVGYGSPAEQVEFGSLGHVDFSGVSEISQHGEDCSGTGVHQQQRFRGGSALSSPDQPSSPQFQRGI